MSTRWESVFVQCSEVQICEIAREIRVLLPYVFRKRLTIDAFPLNVFENTFSLELRGFKSGQIDLIGDIPNDIVDPLKTVPSDFSHRRSALLALAIIASRTIKHATWVFYSDSIGESAGAWFESGNLQNFYESINAFGDEKSYQNRFLATIGNYVPGIVHVDDELYQAIYGDSKPISMSIEG